MGGAPEPLEPPLHPRERAPDGTLSPRLITSTERGGDREPDRRRARDFRGSRTRISRRRHQSRATGSCKTPSALSAAARTRRARAWSIGVIIHLFRYTNVARRVYPNPNRVWTRVPVVLTDLK